jgi:hypothetical protein
MDKAEYKRGYNFCSEKKTNPETERGHHENEVYGRTRPKSSPNGMSTL